MGGDPSRRNQNLYCTYHKDKGHTTKQCRVLRYHLGQQSKAGHLKEFVMDAGDRGTRQGTPQRRNPISPPIGIIEVIHAAPKGLTAVGKKEVLTMVSVEGSSDVLQLRKKMKPTREPITFDDSDLEGMVQPHDEVLIVKARVDGFIVNRIMIDQRSGVDVMYQNLFKWLGLRNEDLSKYSKPLIGFNGKVVVPRGRFLPIHSNTRKAMDLCNGGCPIHSAHKRQVPHRSRYHCGTRKVASSQTMLSRHS
nr:uncharacterized protein LOC112021209 [Quercus suber]